MILRFKKPDRYDEEIIGSFEISDKVMAYIMPYKMEGEMESLHVHFSIEGGKPLNMDTISNIEYEIPFKSRFKSFKWEIESWGDRDGSAISGDFYLIFLIE